MVHRRAPQRGRHLAWHGGDGAFFGHKRPRRRGLPRAGFGLVPRSLGGRDRWRRRRAAPIWPWGTGHEIGHGGRLPRPEGHPRLRAAAARHGLAAERGGGGSRRRRRHLAYLAAGPYRRCPAQPGAVVSEHPAWPARRDAVQGHGHRQNGPRRRLAGGRQRHRQAAAAVSGHGRPGCRAGGPLDRSVFRRTDRPRRQLNIGVFQAGDWPSTVAGRAVMECRVAFIPPQTRQEVQREIESRIAEVASADPWLREHPPAVEWFGWQADPWRQDERHPFISTLGDAVEHVTGQQPPREASTGGLDARLCGAFGIPAACIGARGANMHSIDEYVDLDTVIETTKIIAATIVSWCGVAG